MKREEDWLRQACEEAAREETQALERRLSRAQIRQAEETYQHHRRKALALIRERLGVDVSDIPGSGAAGGAGAGAIAFLNAGLKPGAQIVLEMNHFDELLRSADLVITGEGQLDEQSLRGKAVMTVAEAAKTRRVPVIAVVGNTKGDIEQACQYGIKKVIRTIDFCHDPGQYKASCRQDLYRAVKEMEF